MFKVLRCLSAVDIKADDVTSILDAHFHPELEPDGGSRRNGKFLSLDEMLDEWGKLFEKRLPHPKYLRLRYICKSTTAFPYQNHGGRVCQRFVWPAFFRAFPKGRVLIVELEDNWFHAIWQGQPGDAKNKDPNGRFI